MSVNNSFSSKPLEMTSAKCKTDKVKESRPRMPIWNNFIEGENDRHRHFRAICAFCNKEKWQHGKPSTIEAHLVLHCKEPVPDDIRKRYWTSPRGDSLYNFIITTPNHHEYLYALANYSGKHQTENFIANKISDIIKKIGPHQFAAIVTDNGSNILEKKPDIFTNQEVFKIICDENDIFYISCKRISLIFEPIKRVINLFESHIASLADCFMEIVQIAIALKKIPTSNNFRTLAITIFNFCY
ncbi:24542_t:CDS:2 [Gigaspora margarita]|uniref:24542_t:CDS:1 n=1 Tax=Gigaspora margarita TaxID=4874 RepID=A0ABN7VZ27_GIGMA|nr:24542_t:CDS:2 [Gigaspora margarita]